MGNENKKNNIKRIIQIVLLALLIFTGLIFLIFPPIWAHNSGSYYLNSQLVKRGASGGGSTQLGENGTITLSYTKDVKTIYMNDGSVELPFDNARFNSWTNGNSITGTTDVFGFNCVNYFRFDYNEEYSNAFRNSINNKIYDLVYYIELDNWNSITIRLGYYDIYLEDLLYLSPLNDYDFNRVGIIPTYNILNFSYYNTNSFDAFYTFYDSIDNQLFYVSDNYDVGLLNPNNYSIFRYQYVNIDKDFYTSLIDAAFDRGRDVGFDEGVNSGSMGSIFDVLYKAVNSLGALLSIEVLPNISLWLLLSIPLAISIMVIIFKLLRGNS